MTTVTKANPWRATFELVVAASFWGFGFIATVWALEVLEPGEVTFMRFFLAGCVGLPFILGKDVRRAFKLNLRMSFIPALLLTSTLLFQTWGLRYTTATKSGFITTLYVVMVPMIEALLTRKRIAPILWLCVAVALLGTGLIVNIGAGELNQGDFLTFICAILAAGQIYWIGGLTHRIRFPFAFNILQAVWAMVLCIPLVHFAGLSAKLTQVNHWSIHSILGLLSLAVGSTVIAFYLQVRAQANLSRTVSSLLFLLESPFAMFFSVLLLNEKLSGLQLIGALLIFISAFSATISEARAKE